MKRLICDLRDSLLTPVVHILIFSTRSVKYVGCFSPAGPTVRTLRAAWRKVLFHVRDCLRRLAVTNGTVDAKRSGAHAQ